MIEYNTQEELEELKNNRDFMNTLRVSEQIKDDYNNNNQIVNNEYMIED